MKRVLSLFVVLLFCFCVSCKKAGNVTAADLLSKSFSCGISFTVAGTEFTSDFYKTQEKSKIIITSPKTVENFIFEKAESTVTVSYNGIGISVDMAKFPFSSAAANVLDFYSGDIGKYSVDIHNDEIFLYLNNSGFRVCTVFDSKSLVPLRTFDENRNFEIIYYDYQLL